MSDLGDKILASLKEFGEALERSKTVEGCLFVSEWRYSDATCKECGGEVMTRTRSGPDGKRETTYVCKGCMAAVWFEEGE